MFAIDGVDRAVAYLGAICAGGAAIDVNSRLPLADLGPILSDSEVRFVWAQGPQAAAALAAGLPLPPQVVVAEPVAGCADWRSAARCACSTRPGLPAGRPSVARLAAPAAAGCPPEDAPAAAAPATDWAAITIVVAAGILAAAFIGKLPPALPLLQREFGLSLREAGWVVATFNSLAVASAMFFGLVGDRIGALRFAALGLLALIAGAALGVLAQGAPLLLASRFLEGAGFVAVGVSGPSLIGAATAPADLRKAMGFWAIYLPAGSGLALLLAPMLLQWHGWRPVWLASGGAALAMLAALWLSRRRYRPRAPAPRSLADLTAGLRRPAAWAFALAFACYSVQFFTIMVWLPSFLVQQRGMALAQASLLTALVVLANVPGNLAGGWLLQRHARRSAIVIGASVSMGLCAVLIFAEGLPEAVRFGACAGLSLFGGVLPTAILSSAQILTREPTQVGGIQGLMVQGSNLGQFVAPPLIAAVVGQSAWGEALPVLLACAGGGVACGLVAMRLRA